MSRVRFRRYDGVGRDPQSARLTRMTRTFQNGREPSTCTSGTRLQRTKFLRRGRERSQRLLLDFALLNHARAKYLSWLQRSRRFFCLFPSPLRFALFEPTRERHFLFPAVSGYLYTSHPLVGRVGVAFDFYRFCCILFLFCQLLKSSSDLVMI